MPLKCEKNIKERLVDFSCFLQTFSFEVAFCPHLFGQIFWVLVAIHVKALKSMNMEPENGESSND